MSTAIFGGTFNPVHKGHIAMVQSVIKQFRTDRIIVVPNGNPPHKRDIAITEFHHRYNMLCLAFQSEEAVEVSDYEGGLGEYRYSIDTMRHFRDVYGEDTQFIIGADSLTSIHTWHMYETLLKENRFIVFKREASDGFDEALIKYGSMSREMLLSDMPLYPLSSTVVRKYAQDGSIEDYVTPEVYGYIKEHGLYGGCHDSK